MIDVFYVSDQIWFPHSCLSVAKQRVSDKHACHITDWRTFIWTNEPQMHVRTNVFICRYSHLLLLPVEQFSQSCPSAESLPRLLRIHLFLAHAYTLHECMAIKSPREHTRWHIQEKAEAMAFGAATLTHLARGQTPPKGSLQIPAAMTAVAFGSKISQPKYPSVPTPSTYRYLPQKILNQQTLLKRAPQRGTASLPKPRELLSNGWAPNKTTAMASEARRDVLLRHLQKQVILQHLSVQLRAASTSLLQQPYTPFCSGIRIKSSK